VKPDSSQHGQALLWTTLSSTVDIIFVMAFVIKICLLSRKDNLVRGIRIPMPDISWPWLLWAALLPSTFRIVFFLPCAISLRLQASRRCCLRDTDARLCNVVRGVIFAHNRSYNTDSCSVSSNSWLAYQLSMPSLRVSIALPLVAVVETLVEIMANNANHANSIWSK
jgi:hypothetical protein